MMDVTIIIITYKSENIIYDFIKKIPSNLKTIIIENSQNHALKQYIEKKYKNISVYVKENNGISSSLNFAAELVKTKYFLQISPDIDFNFSDLNLFIDFANKKKDNFAALGPRYLEVKEKSHKQINKNLEYGKIKSIHGSCMFISKLEFVKIGKFDENFFLYFEETEYCHRAKIKGYNSYQLNKSKVKSKGRSVEVLDSEKKKMNNFLIWHFIWSKFYFYRKKYTYYLAIIIFIPIILRTLIKLIFYRFLKKDLNKNEKYYFRFLGLFSSILGKKSSLRIN